MQLNQKGLKLACVTNKPKHFTHKILKEHKMDQLLDFIVSGDEVEKKKPDPMPIHLTCQTLQIKPIESIMVGDSCLDIDAGYNAGTFVVTVPYGYQSGQSIKSNKVDLAVNNLTELLAVIN
jgi:phosphoglycolate phosphatase